MNYPNEQSKNKILFSFMVWLKNCKTSKVTFLCIEENLLRDLKSPGPLVSVPSGQFWFPTTTVICDAQSPFVHLNMNIWKFENPFQKS